MVRLPRISIVIPVRNEAGCLPKLHQELRSVCDPLPYQFEFVFVDDGSTDPTEQVLSPLRRSDERVRYLQLSRDFGHQSALSAGLAHAWGDAVIMMDGDLQHPPSLISMLLDRWRAGYDIVNTVRVETEDIKKSKKILWLFYRVFNLLIIILTTIRATSGLGLGPRSSTRALSETIRSRRDVIAAADTGRGGWPKTNDRGLARSASGPRTRRCKADGPTSRPAPMR